MATITVPDESRRKQVVVGSSAQTAFTFDWVIFDTATDIRVWNGATELVNGTTFSVAGTSGTDGGFDGGTVTLIGTLASGVSNTTVTIEGSTPNNRLSNLAATGPLDIDLLNKDLNRVITMIHQSIDTIKKSPRLADDTTLSLPVTFPAPSASKVISWNSDANALEATVTTGDITSASTKASEAASSATAAASSAASSSSSATAAATSATAAASSATAAAASAASAAVTVASQAEAEAGTNNANVMTALRTKQAVDSYGVVTADDVATSGANKILKLDGSGHLPALNGSNLTSLNASNLGSGTVPTARLGSGTASSSTFLAGDQTYKTVSAGLNHITTVTASDSASLDINSTFSSTYLNYLVVLTNLVPATNNVSMNMLFSADNGSSYITSNYQYVLKNFYVGPSGDGNSESTATSTQLLATSCNNAASDAGTNGNIFIYSPISDAMRTTYVWDLKSRMGDGSNYHQRLVGAGEVGGDTDTNAFQISYSSGNVASGTIRVYGITNS